MYDFGLTDEQKLLRQNIREFAENEIAPVASSLTRRKHFQSTYQEDGRHGAFRIVVPEEYGGAEMDYLSYIIAVEEIARIDGSQAHGCAANSLGIGPIYYFGTRSRSRNGCPGCARVRFWRPSASRKPKPAPMPGRARRRPDSRTASGW